jgi:hypothetical protein
MLIAWRDHEGRVFFLLGHIPLFNANAPIWCLLLPHMGDFGVFFPVLLLFLQRIHAQHKIQAVSFKQLYPAL